MTVTDDVLVEARVRGYSRTETLAVLTCALQAGWLTIPYEFLDDLDAYRARGTSSADAWYNIAAVEALPPREWQGFKDRLYLFIDQAEAVYDDTPIGDLVTPEQAAQLITSMDALTTAIGKLTTDMSQVKADARDTRVQLRGPNDAGWPQLGKNNHGLNLSFIDAMGRVKDKLFGTNNAVS